MIYLFCITIGAVFGISVTYSYWKTFYVMVSKFQGEELRKEYNRLLKEHGVKERLRIVRKDDYRSV